MYTLNMYFVYYNRKKYYIFSPHQALYRELWDKEKTQFTLPADTPEMVLSKMNALNVSKVSSKCEYICKAILTFK